MCSKEAQSNRMSIIGEGLVTILGFPMLLIVVGTLRVPYHLKKGDKILTHPYRSGV